MLDKKLTLLFRPLLRNLSRPVNLKVLHKVKNPTNLPPQDPVVKKRSNDPTQNGGIPVDKIKPTVEKRAKLAPTTQEEDEVEEEDV